MKWKETLWLLLKIGLRNIFRQKRRSYLVISAAFFGSLGVLFTLANLNAFLESMVSMTIEAGLGHVQIRPEGFEKTRKTGLTLEAPELGKLLKKIPDVGGYSPRFEREGMIRAGTGSQGVLFTGIDPSTESRISNYPKWVMDGSFFQDSPQSSSSLGIPCLLGKTNAERLELEVGDFVIVSITDRDGNYRSIRANIIGIFESPSDQIDKYNVLLRREDLSRLYAKRADLVSYWVFLGDGLSRATSIQARLSAALLGQKADGLPIEILTYKEVEPSVVRLFELSEQMRWITHLLMMIGFALILFDSVSMSVFDRMREIGIIRAIGSSGGLVFAMVLFESLLLAAIGAGLGLLAGGGATAWLHVTGLDLGGFAEGLSSMGLGSVLYPYLDLRDLLETFAVTLGVSLLSALYPSWKAVRVSPVQAIYHT